MNTITTAMTLGIAIAATLATIHFAHAAGLADYDIDPRFRAKIVKEKAKQNALEANNFDFNGNGPGNAQCGSQNIGNVDTGGKIGAAPREVFVFAPNSINLVTGRGCQ